MGAILKESLINISQRTRWRFLSAFHGDRGVVPIPGGNELGPPMIRQSGLDRESREDCKRNGGRAEIVVGSEAKSP
jgi:hypothetical protein